MHLIENPDILREVSQLDEQRPRLVIGFAAETENLIEHARQKRARKGCDWIVANSVGAGSDVMGGAENEVTLVTENDIEPWPRAGKAAIADRLAARIAEALA